MNLEKMQGIMTVEIVIHKDNSLVSVIIPSLDGYRNGNVPKLVADLKRQTVKDFELIIVKGEKPCARAHNVGAQRAKGEIIVFFDDDIVLGNNKIIENLVNPLINDNLIGITGASQLIPLNANWFQKKCVQEFTRFQFPVVSKIVESDMATHAAMAIKKEVFMKVGQENEDLIYGDDPDLRYRVRQAGYKIVIIPHTWIYHPPPSNLISFLRISFQRGKGAAHDFLRFPKLIFETPAADSSANFVSQRSIFYRLYRYVAQNLESVIRVKLIFLSVRITYGLGYLFGLLKEILHGK